MKSVDYFLTSARLGFRCWTDDDLPLAMELWSDPDVTALIGGPFTPEMVRARLAKEITQMQQYGVQYWPVFLLKNNQHIGCAGLRPYRVEERVYELGFHLRRAFGGQGLAAEAARAVIDYAFGTLGVKALFAGHHPANEASQRLLLKLGFVRTHDELYPPTGLMHPSYLLRRNPTPTSQKTLR
jgi:[ribosomal protein S5]-alanine N-acetyltransferase